MPRQFEIFTKPSATPVAIKRGFSWPAFFFTWLWAFVGGLWKEGVAILIAGTALSGFKFLLFSGGQTYWPIALFGLALTIYVGTRGNYWRSRKLERNGYSFDGLITAKNAPAAIAIFERGGKDQYSAGASFAFFNVPKWCQKVVAIAWLTWKAALRFKLFLVIAALLILAVVGLPLVIQDDGTAQGFTQIILTYTLSAITGLLGISTLWLSCGTLARDIEECQIQVLATKPIARWQIWIGKWLGLVSLNAVLLAISGGCVFGMLEYRAGKLPADVQKTLREQILVARGTAREATHDQDIEAEASRILENRLKSSPVENPDIPEVRKQIREGVKADFQLVPPSYIRIWKIDLGVQKYFLAGKPLQMRLKFNAADKSPSGSYSLAWQIGDPDAGGKFYQDGADSLAADTFHELVIPPDLFDKDGVLTIAVRNVNPTALLFPLDEGMEVLYPESSFAVNFLRGLGIIFCWLALMAALGLMAASFLSFPVATFFSLAMLVMVFSSGTLADAIDSGSVAAGNEETGQAGHSVADVVLIPAFKGLLSIIRLVQNFSPVDALSTGRSITWSELGLAFAQVVVLIGGIFAVMGIVFFSRRELATAQGTQ